MATAWYLYYHVLPVVLLVLLFTFAGFYAVSDYEVNKEQFKEILVYDVSQIIRSTNYPNETEILPEDLYVRKVNTSANYYFVANDVAGDDICWGDGECKGYGIKGISIIFGGEANTSDVLRTADMPIKKMLKMDNSSIVSVTFLLHDIPSCITITNINIYFQQLEISSIKTSLKMGIEYSDEFLERCAEEAVPLFERLNHTILRIHVTPLTTMLSYGSFFGKVRRLIQTNRKLMQRLNPQSASYIRLLNEDWEKIISAKNYGKYTALLTTYLDIFSQQNSGNEIFIFSPISKQLNFVPSGMFFKQSVSTFYTLIENEKFEYVSQQDKHLLACTHQRMVKFLLSNFQNIMVNDPFLEVFRSLLTACKSSIEDAGPRFNSHSNFSLNLFLFKWAEEQPDVDEQLERVLETIKNNSAEIRISKVYIFTHEDFNNTDSVKKAVDLIHSQHVDIGCVGGAIYNLVNQIPNVSAAIGDTVENCGASFNFSNELVQPVVAAIRKEEDFLRLLIRLDEEKQRFEKLYPGKMLTWYFGLHAHGDIPDSLYCKPESRQTKEYYQTVYSFANIHGWSLLLPRYDWSSSVLWAPVPTNKKIDQGELKFPVLFRSNAPPTADKELPMTYPCIEKTWDASQSHINFLENRYSGATFQLNLRETPPLSTAELQTLLELAATRFPSVEIIAATRADFKRVNVVLANAPIYRHYNVSKPFVYIDIPLAEAQSLGQDIQTLLSNKQAAVHVSNWESPSFKQTSLLNGVENPNFGVIVQNCSHKINSKVETLKSLSFMRQVGYVVCNTPPVTPDNKDSNWMEKYLGTLFYTKTYMEHFLSLQKEAGRGVEVMFRLNYICSETNEMEKFLRFLNDVQQHSVAYKIRYFLVRAFESETSGNCLISWWRPDSYADLSNMSTFLNREDKYAGREAKIPVRPPPEQEPVQSSNAVYFFIIGPIVALFLLIILAQWLYQRKENTRILTQMEVRQFYNGDEQPNPSSGNGCYLDFGNMKFPKQYEIPRKDIETEEVIGRGQFGVVHRGILSKRVEVAIKIPRSDCGKEQFKSTLSELKILCYIGEHLNIVSFLGAHTKGIANGNLHIVIEFCKNGCLLQHLRQNQGNVQDDESISLFQMNGFALQIASGMEYIAEKRVVHGDLAARNVLLTAEWTCKIADFGLSRRLYEMNEYVKTSQEPLPWRWMAPESLRRMEFTSKSDVWSYGVTLWEIFSLGMVPYPGLNWTANHVGELENGMRMSKAPHATDDIHAKILECWDLNSEARPTFTELKDYFVGLRNEQYLNLSKV